MQVGKQQEELAPQSADAAQRFVTLKDKLSKEEYNFEHFRTKHLLADMQGFCCGRVGTLSKFDLSEAMWGEATSSRRLRR